MPRITRAQLRAQETEVSQEFYEDPETNQETSAETNGLTQTDVRAALGELVNVNSTPSQKPDILPCAENKGPKKNHGSGKNRLNLVLAEDENILPSVTPDIIEDEYPSDDSSAAKAAARELRVASPDLVLADTNATQSAPSAAAEQANRALNRSPERNVVAVQGSVNTPKFDLNQHSRMAFAADEPGHDSFEVTIKNRNPAAAPNSQGENEAVSDSFVDDITSRSPSKFTTRIEDSVEALDALEDAIEQVSEELPKGILNTPAKESKTKTAASKPTSKHSSTNTKQQGASRVETSKKPASQKPTRPTALRAQPRPSISATGKKVATVGRPSLGAQPASGDNKRTSSGTLSTSRPGFVPARSTKPPTKSTFTLPGEAISAKMTVKREEMRLKKESDDKKRSEFKARPAPKSVGAGAGQRRVSSIQPRDNATSRARIGMAVVTKKTEDAAAKQAPGLSPTKTLKASSSFKVTRPPARMSLVPVKSTLSRLSVPKARVSQTGQAANSVRSPRTPANTSAPRRNMLAENRSPRKPISSVRKPATVSAGTTVRAGIKKPTSPSTTSAATKKPEPATAAPKLAKGKEVFNRGKLAEAEMQKVKKIKEEAAKKAREAASERGRQASREWALKRMQKNGTVKPVVAAEEPKETEGGEKVAQETEKLVVQEPGAVVVM